MPTTEHYSVGSAGTAEVEKPCSGGKGLQPMLAKKPLKVHTKLVCLWISGRVESFYEILKEQGQFRSRP